MKGPEALSDEIVFMHYQLFEALLRIHYFPVYSYKYIEIAEQIFWAWLAITIIYYCQVKVHHTLTYPNEYKHESNTCNATTKICNDLSIIIYVTQLSPVVSGSQPILLKFSSFDTTYPYFIFPLLALILAVALTAKTCVAVGSGGTNLLFGHILKSTTCQINLKRQSEM